MSPVQLVLFVVAWFCFVVSAFSTTVKVLTIANCLVVRTRFKVNFRSERLWMFVAGTFALIGLWLYQ